MKLIEALKIQKRISSRIAKNCDLINKYSSRLSTEKSYFETDEEQKNEIEKLLQSNKDLVNRYLTIKKCIDYTNIVMSVDIDGKRYSIADLLNMKRNAIEYIRNGYTSLNDVETERRLSRLYSSNSKTDNITIERLYDEKMKNENLMYWNNLYDTIDSRLEVINSVTDLIEDLPEQRPLVMDININDFIA